MSRRRAPAPGALFHSQLASRAVWDRGFTTRNVNGQPHSDAWDEEFARVREYFSKSEVVELRYAVVAINGWNMLNRSLRNPIPEVPAPGL